MNLQLRYVITLALSSMFTLPSWLVAQQGPNQMNAGQAQYAINPEALESPEFQQMVAEAEQFLSGLSEEEMEDFLGFYEEFLQGVESGDIDLTEFLPEGVVQKVEPTETQEATTQEVAPTPEPKKPLPKIEDVESIGQLIQHVIDHINAVRQKAANDDTIADKLRPWDSQLDTLIVYLDIITKKKHVRPLITEAEHKPLLNDIKDLHKQLTEYEPKVKVPAFGLGELPKQEKEASQAALKKIITSFEYALVNKNILGSIEQLLKKYEPEALKKAQLMQEAEKRAQQKRPTPISPGPGRYYEPTPAPTAPAYQPREYAPEYNAYDDYPSSYWDDYYSPTADYLDEPSKYDEPAEAAQAGAVPGAAAKKGVTPTEKKDTDKQEAKPKKRTLSRQEKKTKRSLSGIRYTLEQLDEYCDDNKKDIAELSTYIGAEKLDKEKLNKHLQEITKRLAFVAEQLFNKFDKERANLSPAAQEEFTKKLKDTIKKYMPKPVSDLYDRSKDVRDKKIVEDFNKRYRQVMKAEPTSEKPTAEKEPEEPTQKPAPKPDAPPVKPTKPTEDEAAQPETLEEILEEGETLRGLFGEEPTQK